MRSSTLAGCIVVGLVSPLPYASPTPAYVGQVVCQATAIPKPPPSLNCGILGRLSKPKTPFLSQNVTRYDRCGYACLSHKDCVSFDYNTTSYLCALKDTSVLAQNPVQGSKDFAQVFYNRKCFTSSCSTVTATSTTATSSATSTSNTCLENAPAATFLAQVPASVSTYGGQYLAWGSPGFNYLVTDSDDATPLTLRSTDCALIDTTDGYRDYMNGQYDSSSLYGTDDGSGLAYDALVTCLIDSESVLNCQSTEVVGSVNSVFYQYSQQTNLQLEVPGTDSGGIEITLTAVTPPTPTPS